MRQPDQNSTLFDRACRRRYSAAPQPANRIGNTMSATIAKPHKSSRHRGKPRLVTGLTSFVLPMLLAVVAVLGLNTTTALACACGCSVFDVGGLDLPQEQDHGGRVFFEFWSGDQTQNYVGSSRASAALNSDKNINTQWYNVGFSYNFNRDWGVMVRMPYVNRSLTTVTGIDFPGSLSTFNATDFGDLEVMGMYTGFFSDMSTGIIFGLKLPTAPYATPGFDRDNQIGSGSTDLLLGGFHRGLLTGDNAWQYFAQAMWRQPFLYRDAADPQGFFDGNPGVVQSYHPGLQVDGAVGIIYNNWYNVFGFDKITPLGQVIISHRNHDSGTGADPFNSGFDRVMLSPGIEFTKVLDEANNRVFKAYFDIEVPVYYRANAANNNGTEGQLVAPYLIKVVTSYNF
jgi:hypothetical protein